MSGKNNNYIEDLFKSFYGKYNLKGSINKIDFQKKYIFMVFANLFITIPLPIWHASIYRGNDGALLLYVPPLIVFWITLHYHVQRLHDLDRPTSDWIYLLVPIYNFYVTYQLLFKERNQSSDSINVDKESFKSNLNTSLKKAKESVSSITKNFAKKKTIDSIDLIKSDLEKLSKMKNDGLITEDDYNKKKKELLKL